MKRSLLDITQKISRKVNKVVLTESNLTDTYYAIFEAKGWKFVDVLREVEFRDSQDRVMISVNTQTITPRDYVIEMGNSGLVVKFIKHQFEYQLDGNDYIEMKGDIEQYA
jgi:hypothetical protein